MGHYYSFCSAAAVPQQQQMEYRGSIAFTASTAVSMIFGVAGAFTWPSNFYGAPVVYPIGEHLVQQKTPVGINERPIV